MRKTEGKIRIVWALLLSFLITGLYFILIYQKIPFIYDINDDVAMRNVAAGVITGRPDAHLLHIKYLLGLLISGLYTALPGWDWYGLVMTGIFLFSFAMILYRGLVSENSLLWKAVYTALALLLLTAMGLQHITAFQWTVTAAMAGGSGIYLFCTAETKERFQLCLEEGIAVVLILLSLAIRDDVFLMTLPIAGICFLWKYFTYEKGSRFPFRLAHLGVPLGLLAGVILIMGVEAYAYRSPEWKEFRSYNIDREAIMDYYGLQNYEEAPELYDSLGITPEEAENMQRYSLYLVDGLYSEKMSQIAAYSKETYLQQHPFRERFATAIGDIREHLTKESYYPANYICIVVILISLTVCFLKNRKDFYLGLTFLVIWGLYWFYLGYRDRMIERVGFSLYFLGFLTMLALWYRALPCFGRKTRRTAAAVFLLLLVPICAKTWEKVETNNRWRWEYNQEFLDVNRYMAEHGENVYFMTTFSIETYTDNFTVKRDFAFSNLLSVGGWHTFSPLENEKNAKLGICDPKSDIVKKDNVYVISLENINLRYMDRYYESIYGENCYGRELTDRLDYGERVFEVYDFNAEEEIE